VVVAANLNIVERAEKHPEFKGMGTTLTMLFARHTDVILAHVGDSRAYLINGNNGDIVQLTADHSFVQALVDAGHISPEEAEDHPMKNVLYRALGQGDEIAVDIQQGLHLHIGDRLVMCSDGLTLHVKAHEIADIAMQEDTPQGCTRRLIDLANDRGGRDNISVISIYVVRAPAEEPDESAMSHDDEDADYLDDDDEPTILLHDRSSLLKPEQDGEKPRDSAVEISQSEVDGEGRDLSEPEFHS
jgi:protein phosphatase